MPIEKLRPSFSFDEERIKQLKQIVPEAFADNQVNWEVLKEALGNYLEEDDIDVEHFGLFWPGKREARRMASIPSKGTLVPCPGEGIDEENTRNIFIEGENLEVLKILQKSYAGRVKMIYIDPPYNTGNDFVYDDNFTEPLEEYLRRTGQIDEEGKPLTTNKKSDGRFHSKWLSMIYPRLRLARNLLSETGILFASIDENEIHNLRSVLNEIFGEENFISNLVWQSRTSISNDQEISLNHNHTLVYAKERASVNFKGIGLDIQDYKNPDNDPRGPWKLVPIDANKPGGDTKYPIKNPKTGKVYYPPSNRSWSVNSQDFQKLLDDGRIKFGMTDDSSPKKKLYLKERQEKGDSKTPSSLLLDAGTTKDGTKEIMNLFEGKKYFSYPKPTSFIRRLLEFGIEDNDIVLDFFAGSGSTGVALCQKNSDEVQSNSFILVQLPELIAEEKKEYFSEFTNIAEITKERLRRDLSKYSENILVSNLGFKSFKLAKSNFKYWQDFNSNDLNKLEDIFSSLESNLVENWNEDNLLIEILMLEGFPFESKIEEIREYTKNKVQQVTSDFCEHKLLVCLDKKVHSETIKNLQLGDTDIFICLDNAITDEEKVTLSDKGLIKTI